MLGAIIGDLAGSLYEYDEFKSKKKNLEKRLEVLSKDNLIEKDSFYSDDTILAIAVLDAILNGKNYEDYLKKYGLKYCEYEPKTKVNHFKYMFSPRFIKWCRGEISGNSMGNGALTRIVPVGYLFDDIETVNAESEKATIPSHDSALAIISAAALSDLIYLGRRGYSKDEVMKKFYPIHRSLDKIRLDNSFDSSCLVFDKCLAAFFASDSFEDAVRKAVSLGGDTDTIGAVTGSLAEAYYGVPDDLKEQALSKLPDDFVLKLNEGYQKVKKL